MIKRNFLAGLFLTLLTALTPLAAQQVPPDEIAKRLTVEVQDIVRNDKNIQAGDQARILALIDEKLIKYFDFQHMTQLALGREWRNATAAQRTALTKEFQSLLVRSYSGALTTYKDSIIDFKPLRMDPKDTVITMRTEVRQPGGKPISIDYDAEKQGNDWKVFDVIVAGVSLVTNYRDSFNQEVKAGGIDGLIKSLQEKNRQLAARQEAGAKK